MLLGEMRVGFPGVQRELPGRTSGNSALQGAAESSDRIM